MPITVTLQSKTWTVFAHSNTGIMGSNPTWGMDVCVCLFCIYAALYAGSGIATVWSPSPRSPTDCVKDQETEKVAKA
jgi:hypothetical protein